MTTLLALSLCLTAAAEPVPGMVRVQGPAATGTGLAWDPALTDASPAADRELAWEAAVHLETRPGAWYQRVVLLRRVRPAEPLTPEALAEDAARLETFFLRRGWREAAVTPTLRPGRREGVKDVLFEVDLGPRPEGIRPPPLQPEPEPGWAIRPLVNGLARGAALSAYGGVAADWRPEGPQALSLHGEVGVRAFPKPDPEVPFGGDIGLWADLSAEGSRDLGAGLVGFAGIRGTSDLWPALNEASPTAGLGLRAQGAGPISIEGALRAGVWRSWAWPGQESAYEPWFGGEPLAAGPRQFPPDYAFGRVDLSLVLDTTDRSVMPRRGARLALRTTPLGLAEGTPFHRAELEGRLFLPLVGQRLIWATRGRVGGVAWQDAEGRALLGERFFLGAVDMRSWGRRRVVPPDHPGDRYGLRPGGNLVTYGNTEVWWHLHRDLSLSVFGDVGRVWERVDQIEGADLLWDAGLSVAVPSPLGAVRVDLVYRITDQAIDGPLPVAGQFWLDQRW